MLFCVAVRNRIRCVKVGARAASRPHTANETANAVVDKKSARPEPWSCFALGHISVKNLFGLFSSHLRNSIRANLRIRASPVGTHSRTERRLVADVLVMAAVELRAASHLRRPGRNPDSPIHYLM